MQEGGDRRKSPNKTGTQPNPLTKSPKKPADKSTAGAGKGAAKAKHAAEKTRGVATSETRQAGPRKVAARTTSRSGEKNGG